MVWVLLLSPLFAKDPVSPKGPDHAAKVELDRTNQPEGHKVALDKIVFEARVVSLGQVLGRKSDQTLSATFLVISAETIENLGNRLLWGDVEVELSDGRKLKFERFNFHGLSAGIEGDFRRLDDSDAQVVAGADPNKSFKLPGEGLPIASGKPIKVKELRVSNLQFK
jgi:hypothetical protein